MSQTNLNWIPHPFLWKGLAFIRSSFLLRQLEITGTLSTVACTKNAQTQQLLLTLLSENKKFTKNLCKVLHNPGYMLCCHLGEAMRTQWVCLPPLLPAWSALHCTWLNSTMWESVCQSRAWYTCGPSLRAEPWAPGHPRVSTSYFQWDAVKCPHRLHALDTCLSYAALECLG